jgi:hypothetical protein
MSDIFNDYGQTTPQASASGVPDATADIFANYPTLPVPVLNRRKRRKSPYHPNSRHSQMPNKCRSICRRLTMCSPR